VPDPEGKTIPTLVTDNCAALFKEAIPWQQPQLVDRFRKNNVDIPETPKEATFKVIEVSFDPLDKEAALKELPQEQRSVFKKIFFDQIDGGHSISGTERGFILDTLNRTFGPYNFYFIDVSGRIDHNAKDVLRIGVLTEESAKTQGGFYSSDFHFIALSPNDTSDPGAAVHEFMHSRGIGHPHDHQNNENPYNGFGKILNLPAERVSLRANEVQASGALKTQTGMSYKTNDLCNTYDSPLGIADHVLLASRYGVDSKSVSDVDVFLFSDGFTTRILPSGRVNLRIEDAEKIIFSTVPPSVENVGVGTIARKDSKNNTQEGVIYVTPYAVVESLTLHDVVEGTLTLGSQTGRTEIHLGNKTPAGEPLTVTVLPSDQDQEITVFGYDPKEHNVNIRVEGGKGSLIVNGVPGEVIEKPLWVSREVTVDTTVKHTPKPPCDDEMCQINQFQEKQFQEQQR
jgi:hypothetical protein